MPAELTIEQRRELVLAAIERCERTEKRYLEHGYKSWIAWDEFKQYEREFGGQWRNVKAILEDSKARETKCSLVVNVLVERLIELLDKDPSLWESAADGGTGMSTAPNTFEIQGRQRWKQK